MLRRSTLFICVAISGYVICKPNCALLAEPAAKPGSAAERRAESSFKAGVTLLKQEKYPQALIQFQKALQITPNDPDTLWNAGSAAFFSSDYKRAATYFERNLKQEPQNGRLFAKLVQTYQALGDITRRNTYRAKIFALYRSKKDVSGYMKDGNYCRDQFNVNGNRVLAFESFDLRPQSTQADGYFFGKRYEFYVIDPKQEQPKMRLEVGWNSLDPDGKGGFRPAAEMAAFYFDSYYPTGEYSRKTYGLYSQELHYEAVKQQLIAILNSKVAPISGKKRGEAGT